MARSQLLQLIVETAAHVIDAQAGSLCLLNEEAQELTFEVALGEVAEEMKKVTLPVGHGVAGLVALSGHPMAVSDAQMDWRHASEVAQRVGYSPKSILAVPLIYNEQVIGVLELLDKIGARGFTSADIETLGLFANTAAIAIQQSRVHSALAALVGEVLLSIGGPGAVRAPADIRSSGVFAAVLEEDASFRRTVHLAELVHEVAQQGDRELAMCEQILDAVASYLRVRPGWVAGPTAFR